MQQEPDFFHNLNEEMRDGKRWVERTVVLAYAAVAGLSVVGFTLLAEAAFGLFERVHQWNGGWLVLLWMPAVTALAVWATRRWAPGAGGSGIPQVIATLEPSVDASLRKRFVSLWLSFAKIFLSSAGFMAGLSIGREGPSVQVAAGVMHSARRWLGPNSAISTHALLVAGGAAGIAAAFNAPLAGVVFAIEELSRKLESRSSGLIIAAIVLAGLMGVSVFGNLSYFGRIRVAQLSWTDFLPCLVVALTCGVLGGLFAKLMTISLTSSTERLNKLKNRFPIRFAATLALLIAIIGFVTGGATFGAGSEAVKHMLQGEADVPEFYVTLKFIATWLSAWVGVPGGVFAPSLSIGAGVGNNVASIVGTTDIAPALIAMGMAAFLAAVTQAPLTAFIIVMEMVDGHSLVLSLMASAMIASMVSRMIARPLYESLALHMLNVARASMVLPEPPAQESAESDSQAPDSDLPEAAAQPQAAQQGELPFDAAPNGAGAAPRS